MKRQLAAFLFVSSGIVTGCASTFDRGLEAFNKGDCKTAYQHWLAAANGGDSAAKYNVGVVHERGCPGSFVSASYPTAYTWFEASARDNYVPAYYVLGTYFRYGRYVARDDNKAIAHFHYAARWGHAEAAQALRQMNALVPAPDLLNAKKAADDEAMVGLSMLALAAVAGAAQGYADGKAAANTRATTTAPGPATRTAVYVPAGCSSDFNCAHGSACVKPMYQSTGVCLQAVNAMGMPTFRTPDPRSVQPNLPPPGAKKGCTYPSLGCPNGFTCDESLNACVK
jgi:hypothetical protein